MMARPIEVVGQRLTASGCRPRGASARCPAHEDNNPSLSVHEGDDGRVLLNCHAGCTLDAILAALNLTTTDLFADTTTSPPPATVLQLPAREVATYPYGDEHGHLLMEVVRYEPKDFRQRRPDGNGGWTWTTRDVRRVPYRLPQLLAAVHDGRRVFVVEGERDADRLAKLGLVATCNVGGAGKWRPEYAAHLAGAHVTVLPDCDEAGRRHAARVAASLLPVAASVSIVELPGLSEHGDASDWLDQGGTVEQLRALVEAAPPLTHPPPDTAADEAVAKEADRLRVQRAARRIVDAEERPPATLPTMVTLADRLAHPPPPVDYRIDGWQPANSRVVLAAQFKAGKTTLTGNLLRSLVDGDRWLGAADVAQLRGNVALIDTEMSDRQLLAWLADQRIRNAHRIIPISLRGATGAFDLIDADVRARWANLLREHQISYVVLDCLRPVLDALGLNEHTDAGRFLVPFDQLLADGGVADACVVHHMGHQGERSRGDSRLRDWPDVEWRLVRENADDPASPRYLAAYGRDVEVAESRLEFDPVTRHLTLVGGSRGDQDVEEALVAVLALLAEESKLSGRKVEERLGENHKRAPVRKALKQGIECGLIVVEPGSHKAVLHSSAPVRRSAPPVRRRTMNECASAPIGGALRTQGEDGSVRQPKSGALDGSGTWSSHDTPEPCGQPAHMRLDGEPRHKVDCATADGATA